ncbi:YHS domain-containing (seleno)protein [soil metagenome]
MRYLRIACVVALGAGILTGFGVDAWAITERVVVNRVTGLAVDGCDPVAYFTDAAAIRGEREIEAANGGAVWRFRNEANRAAFLSHPEIYAPRFGGYDPVDVARGKIVAGQAQVWLVSGERLYLFSRDDNRSTFAADPQAILKQADDKWPVLLDTLSGY